MEATDSDELEGGMWLTCLSDKPVAVVPFFVDFDMCILIGRTVNREMLESRRTRLNQCC